MRMFGALTQGPSSPSGEVPVKGDSVYRRTFAAEFGFGSAHPNVLLAVFGDGSTEIVSESADLILLDRLGKRSDGSVASLE
jgi:hypothetical protein